MRQLLETSGRRHLPPELLEHELELARRVQESLFPGDLPMPPGVRLAAVNQPARVVSGDLYDVVSIDPGRIAILCADVSGKGLPAALLASEVHAIFRSMLRAACVSGDNQPATLPVQIMALLNGEFSHARETAHYATVFLADFDAHEGVLHYVNAGHNPPLPITPGAAVEQLTVGGPPVGMFDDSTYDAGTIAVPPDGTLVIYTDGVTEARNAHDNEFGLERLIEVCLHERGRIDRFLSELLQALTTWRGEAGQTDDITVVGLERTE
jgi:sigma-B regulation protein RsbU (phosphoserine phosphatase)